MTNAEALRLHPGDKISQRPHLGNPRLASFTVARVTVSGEGLIIATTTSGAVTITLTFDEIEAVTGPLPDEARSYAAWWGTTPFGCYTNAHALGWWHAGYVADRPDFAAQTITFRRLAR